MTDVAPSPVLSPPAAGPVEPIAAVERFVVIDILRGFALFGILLVNMAFFGAPLSVAFMGTPWWTAPVDHVAEWLIHALAEGKFYALFSFLFGLGMSIQMERVEARGGRFVRVYIRRLCVLLAVGLLHALLLWYGDILTLYALVGFVLLWMRGRSNRTILTAALIVYCIPLLFVALSTVAVSLGRLLPESAATIDAQFAQQQQFWLDSAQRSITAYRSGSFAEIFWQRLEDWGNLGIGTLFIAPGVFAMFMLGLYAGRQRILHEPAAHLRLWRRLLVWGLPLGLLGNALYATTLAVGSRTEPSWTMLAGFAGQLTAPLLTFAYGAAIILLVQRREWQRRLAPLAALGRMALSNYLLQTLVCTTLFYGYGLGQFGRVGPAAGILLTIVIYAIQLPLSVFWLRHFRFGPLEWLWRSLTYAKWQPLRA